MRSEAQRHATARLLGDFVGVFGRIFAELVVDLVVEIVPNIGVAPHLTAPSAAAAMIVSDSARGGGGALIDRLSAKYRRVFDGARGCAEGSAPRE